MKLNKVVQLCLHLKRPRHRWEDDIREDLRKGWCGLDASYDRDQ
jgi:hypothetical protein